MNNFYGKNATLQSEFCGGDCAALCIISSYAPNWYYILSLRSFVVFVHSDVQKQSVAASSFACQEQDALLMSISVLKSFGPWTKFATLKMHQTGSLCVPKISRILSRPTEVCTLYALYLIGLYLFSVQVWNNEQRFIQTSTIRGDD